MAGIWAKVALMEALWDLLLVAEVLLIGYSVMFAAPDGGATAHVIHRGSLW